MDFKLWLENQQFNMSHLPLVLRGLAAEAVKAGSYEEFQRDFLGQIKHGLYWHWTDDPNFQIDLAKGPRDMSSMAAGRMDPGALMITSRLVDWEHYGERPYAAIIDMTRVPRKAYYQVNRGFGNEFFVSDPSQARVVEVLPRKKAFAKANQQHKHIEKAFQSHADLQAFYDAATGVRQQMESVEGIEQLRQQLKSQYPTLELDVSENLWQIELSRIRIPKEDRRGGIGANVIQSIQEYARSVNKPIGLSEDPQPRYKAKLHRFYRALGFRSNINKGGQYNGSMIWYPN